MPFSKEILEEEDRTPKEKWICDNCGFENDDNDNTCQNCGASKDGYEQSGDYGGATESDFGGDPLWDDDQGLM
jgi:rubredoxin